jgi:hypothetical protein
MIVRTEVLCVTCGVPFTRSGPASGSSNFYRTREENDRCICCREGLDPETLAPLGGKDPTMKPCDEMTDSDLIENLELAATRARLARTEDLRKIADAIAELALEAADRLREILAIAQPWPTKDVLARLADAADHLLRDHGCDAHGYEGVGAARDQARAIAARISAPDAGAGGREVPPGFMAGPLLGHVRNVTLHADGRMTADLTVNGAGAEFIRRINSAAADLPDADHLLRDLDAGDLARFRRERGDRT